MNLEHMGTRVNDGGIRGAYREEGMEASEYADLSLGHTATMISNGKNQGLLKRDPKTGLTYRVET